MSILTDEQLQRLRTAAGDNAVRYWTNNFIAQTGSDLLDTVTDLQAQLAESKAAHEQELKAQRKTLDALARDAVLEYMNSEALRYCHLFSLEESTNSTYVEHALKEKFSALRAQLAEAQAALAQLAEEASTKFHVYAQAEMDYALAEKIEAERDALRAQLAESEATLAAAQKELANRIHTELDASERARQATAQLERSPGRRTK